VSGWGQFGPDADRPGYDPVTLAASGWMSLNGIEGDPPTRAPTFLADDLAGLHAVIGALAALRHRDRTGEGQHVDVSMLDSVLFSSSGFLTLGACGVPLHRWGNEVDIVVPANTFACADGDVYLVVALDKHWRALTDVIDRPELADGFGFATNEQRRHNRGAVNRVVSDWCKNRPVSDVERSLSDRGITVAPVRTYADAARDPHVLAREMLQVTELRNGTSAPLTGPAVKFSRTPTRIRTSAPDPGTDTEAVLAELGILEGTGDSPDD
jgi:formyl-CoA transferase